MGYQRASMAVGSKLFGRLSAAVADFSVIKGLFEALKIFFGHVDGAFSGIAAECYAYRARGLHFTGLQKTLPC